MSTITHPSPHDAHPHADGHDKSHGSLKSYIVGFLLSLVLTLASFGAVMTDLVPRESRLLALVVLCIVQLLVQLVYFLHLGASRTQRDNTGVFICTALLIAIIVAGSLWVMHNANENMMPMQMSVDQAKSRP